MLAEMNMGSAVYATPVPAHGALFLNNRNQLFALASADGEVDGTTELRPRSRRSRSSTKTCRGLLLRSSCSRWSSCRVALVGASAPGAGRSWPQFRGNAAADRRRRRRAARHADAEVDLRGRRGDRVVGGDRRRRRLRRRRRTAICSRIDLATGKLRWKYATGGLIGESSPAVGGGAGVHRRSRRHRPRRATSRDGTPAVDVQDRRRGQVVAGAGRRPGADRLVRHAPLRARAPHRQAALEAADRRPGARDAGGRQTASIYIAGCDEQFRARPRRRRQGAVRDSARRLHRARRRSSTATAPTSARSTTKCSRVDLQRAEDRLALPRSGPRVSVLLVGGAGRTAA